jgi:hypothetical protein
MGWSAIEEEEEEEEVLVNRIMNLRIPIEAGNFLTSLATLFFPRKLCFMELSTYRPA